jgi:hypothetical protein
MKTAVYLLLLVFSVGCATTGPRSSPTEIRDPSQNTTHLQGVTVPIFRFYPFSYPIDDALKWLSTKLPGGTAKRP